MVRITEVTFLPMGPDPRGFLGLASCIFEDKLKLSGIGVYSSLSGGYRLLYPIVQYPHGKVTNSVYPIDKETGRILTEAISDKIKEIGTKRGNKPHGEIYYEPYLDS